MKLHKLQQCLAMQNAFVLMDPAVGPLELKSLCQTCTYFSTISSKCNGPVGKNLKFHFIHSNQVILSQLSGRWADVSRSSCGPQPQPTITSKEGLKKHWGSIRLSHIIRHLSFLSTFLKTHNNLNEKIKWYIREMKAGFLITKLKISTDKGARLYTQACVVAGMVVQLLLFYRGSESVKIVFCKWRLSYTLLQHSSVYIYASNTSTYLNNYQQIPEWQISQWPKQQNQKRLWFWLK